ncbi:MAG: complex I NDUFA9 subunit family protein [Rubrivivax sp.]|nr:complex I NDUFA9 subunit family protein [Rubrivivax sp.]
MKDQVAVLGGTGFVGHAVCEHLVERSGGAGGRIVVPTRRLRHGLALQSLPTVQLVQANVHDDRDLARVLAGCEAVVHLVAILHGSEAEFDRVHVQLPQRVAAACKAAGVRRVVHVSALGVAPDAPSRYLRSKAAGEQVWRESGLDVTVLRPSVIFGARDRFLNLFAQLQALAPFVPLGGAHARFQPVWVEDVAAAVVRCLDQPATIGQVFECAGPQQFTLADLVRLAGRLSGHPRPVLPLPGALARLQALVMEYLPGEPLMSRDNVDSMQVPNVATPGQPGLEALGVQASGVEGVAAGYLGGVDGPGRFMPWRSRHR